MEVPRTGPVVATSRFPATLGESTHGDLNHPPVASEPQGRRRGEGHRVLHADRSWRIWTCGPRPGCRPARPDGPIELSEPTKKPAPTGGWPRRAEWRRRESSAVGLRPVLNGLAGPRGRSSTRLQPARVEPTYSGAHGLVSYYITVGYRYTWKCVPCCVPFSILKGASHWTSTTTQASACRRPPSDPLAGAGARRYR